MSTNSDLKIVKLWMIIRTVILKLFNFSVSRRVCSIKKLCLNMDPTRPQLVHQCSWQQWIRSSLAFSSETVKLWRSWRWGGHGGHDGFYGRFWYKYSYSMIFFGIACAQLAGTVCPSFDWRSKRPLKRPLHSWRTT